MNQKDRILLQAALNKNSVMYSSVANILKQNDISIEIDDFTKSIRFKSRSSVVTLNLNTMDIIGLKLINGYDFSKLLRFFVPHKNGFLINDYLYMRDNNTINKIERLVRMGEQKVTPIVPKQMDLLEVSELAKVEQAREEKVYLMSAQYYWDDIAKIKTNILSVIDTKAEANHTHPDYPSTDQKS